jgi:hypothetical protein
MTTPSNISGELREWYEVHFNEGYLIHGKLYGDNKKIRKDGYPLSTGKVVERKERGDYFLIDCDGGSRYMLYKKHKHPTK